MMSDPGVETKGHTGEGGIATFASVINDKKEASGKYTFRGLPFAVIRLIKSAGPFVS